jgi:putative cardiolipin synthase
MIRVRILDASSVSIVAEGADPGRRIPGASSPAAGRHLGALALTIILVAGAGCASATRPAGMAAPVSSAMSNTDDTALGQSTTLHLGGQTGESVFYPLSLGAEAFVARLGLARAAERSLDVQYYMIHNDGTGNALFREMLHAANRGVRVRLLIDDIHTEKEDALLAALDAHPHMEVRIFNPFRHRSSRWLDFLTDYRRVNRRMHNKSITADNQATIVGGRNVGDEYFAAGSELDFSDLDVLAGGAVVPEVSAEFDRYWNSAVVWPVNPLLGPAPTTAAVQAQYDLLEQSMAVEKQTAYAKALPALELVQAIEKRQLQVFRGTASVISDPPEKVTQPVDESAHAILKLTEIMEQAQQEIFLISPYFVPGGKGTKWLVAQAERGVKIRILTNSFLATDVGAVHSGYMTYRPKLLKAGIEIYELKPTAEAVLAKQAAKKDGKKEDKPDGVGGSRASLHAKTYMVDRKTIFIGSLNLDPRSARLNTEMGLVLESPELARRFTGKFDAQILDMAYRVELRPDGVTTWTTREDGKEVVVDSEPGMGALKRFGMFIARVLPMEEQL